MPMLQVAQLDAGLPEAGTSSHPRMVDVIELMAAVLEDSPSNRLTMLQTPGLAAYACVLLHLMLCCLPSSDTSGRGCY